MSQDEHEASAAASARAAKAQVRRLVAGDSRVNGVGLTRSPGWAVKVNVVDADDFPELPKSVGGIPVRVHAVGRIHAAGGFTARAS